MVVIKFKDSITDFEGIEYPREIIRRIYNNICQRCGKVWEEGKRRHE